ncbi:hypothetical protein CgunFtcFv8_006057 [Champsocephalus gunnari]|uniref:Uncharacterized protein n=1 Tax=Champsocephalus gunnari TaxID=52237 RepID=A0AAN8BXM7_CHAGU|nr:hypothetical protein CgunFtcFv8_006057 [Champsocephalus gunnari]
MQQIGSLCGAQMGRVLGNKRGRVCGGLSAPHSRGEGSGTGSRLICTQSEEGIRHDGIGNQRSTKKSCK